MSNLNVVGTVETGRDDEELARLVDELARRVEDGDLSGVDDLLVKNPIHESALREILPTMKALAEFENDLAVTAEGQESLDAPKPRTSLGDFRLIREIGRGGMGVVYEAYQLQCNAR